MCCGAVPTQTMECSSLENPSTPTKKKGKFCGALCLAPVKKIKELGVGTLEQWEIMWRSRTALCLGQFKIKGLTNVLAHLNKGKFCGALETPGH